MRVTQLEVLHQGFDQRVSVGGDAATRDALGLPTGVPLIATGHQPGRHHGGIVAKDMAAAAMARRLGGVHVHLLVDTGAPAATTVDVAERLDGVWRAGQHQVPARPDAAFMQAQWDRFGLRPVVIYASDLLATPAGRVLVSRMHEDAPACLAALAEATRTHPAAQMRVLEPGEAPMWRVYGEARRAACVDDLIDASAVLHPRAVLTTALMRHAVCDLFVHGTGGARYDAVTEAWWAAWHDLPLCPMAVTTAHVRLDDAALAQARDEVARAQAHVRRLEHDGGDPQAKRALVEQIEAMPRGSDERRAAFAAMHKALAARATDALVEAAAALQAAEAMATLLERRDLPLVDLPQAVQQSFIEACNEAFGPVA